MTDKSLEDIAKALLEGRQATSAELEELATDYLRIKGDNKRLGESNRALQDLASVVSHELKTPINVTAGYAQMLLEGVYCKLGGDARKTVEKIWRNAEQMSNLITDLTQDALAGEKDLLYSKVDLSEMAREIQNKLQERESHPVKFDIQDGLYVEGDKGLLQIVLMNLIGNAVKYSGKNGNPEVEVGEAIYDGDNLQHKGKKAIFVKDNGVGIDKSEATKLFQRFQRLSTGINFPGTGIGLSIVAKIIERHKGSYWADSQIGKGSTFYFTLNESPRY